MQPATGNESGRLYKNFPMREMDVNRSLASRSSFYATCYDPMSMAAAGYYAVHGSSLGDLEASASAVASNAAFAHAYSSRSNAGMRSMAQAITGLAAGMPRSFEMAILSGTSSNSISAGMWGFPSDFDGLSFLKVEKDDPRYNDVGSNTAQRIALTFPSATGTSSSSSSSTTTSKPGGESIPSSNSSHATPTSPSSTVPFQADSRRSLADQRTETNKRSSQDANLDTSVAHSSASLEPSSPSKSHRSVPGERKDEAYREKRRKNNESAKRSREARRQKEEQVMLRVLALEDESVRLRQNLACFKLYVQDMQKSIESA